MKNAPLTQAQRKSEQRRRDKEILNACGIESLESIMKQIRKLDDDGKQQLYSVLFGRNEEAVEAINKARPQIKRTRKTETGKALARG